MIVVEVFLEMAYSYTIPCRKVVIARNQLLTFVAVIYIVMKSTEQIFIRSGSLHATFKSILGISWDCVENGRNLLKCMLSQRERNGVEDQGKRDLIYS